MGSQTTKNNPIWCDTGCGKEAVLLVSQGKTSTKEHKIPVNRIKELVLAVMAVW
jgi:hypothetical protein